LKIKAKIKRFLKTKAKANFGLVGQEFVYIPRIKQPYEKQSSPSMWELV